MSDEERMACLLRGETEGRWVLVFVVMQGEKGRGKRRLGLFCNWACNFFGLSFDGV